MHLLKHDYANGVKKLQQNIKVKIIVDLNNFYLKLNKD